MAETNLDQRYFTARQRLEPVGQTHVLHFWDELDQGGKEKLLAEIEGIDWPEVGRLVQSHVLNRPQFSLPQGLQPAPWYPNQPESRGRREQYRKARKLGEKLLTAGKVAAFTVAGGQGTRLGWNGPKGTFPATAIRKLPLFACMGEYIRKLEQKYGTTVPWYIMTSDANDAETRTFFENHGFFGLDPADVMFFRQAMMPAFSMPGQAGGGGKVLLAARDGMALAPNGHGGSLKALWTSGAIADMKARGIEQISYTQVDNPIVKMVDPLFIGLHVADECQMSSKMLPKAYPREKLGNFCVIDGKLTVIEYSNLPDEYAEQRDENGELRFKAGSIALHAIWVDFVEWLNTRPEGFAMPWNRAEKKVPYLDIQTGTLLEPREPNAVKLETFVFDALPLCDRTIVYETDRVEEFAPIKNADAPGAVDTPSTSMRTQTERAARWLEANGVNVARTADGSVDAVIEISHLAAIEAQDLKTQNIPAQIDRGTEVLL